MIIPAPEPLDLNEGPKPAAKTNVQPKVKNYGTQNWCLANANASSHIIGLFVQVKFLLECNNSHDGYGLTHASNFFQYSMVRLIIGRRFVNVLVVLFKW